MAAKFQFNYETPIFDYVFGRPNQFQVLTFNGQQKVGEVPYLKVFSFRFIA